MRNALRIAEFRESIDFLTRIALPWGSLRWHICLSVVVLTLPVTQVIVGGLLPVYTGVLCANILVGVLLQHLNSTGRISLM